MSFSQTTITHRWVNADQTAASGSIVFALSDRITNGGVSIVPASEITVNLDATGSISQAVTSNLDSGTTPLDSTWNVYIRVAGASQEEQVIVVPSAGGTVDLGTLLAEVQQVQ
jgi:hypothetical protein